MALCLNIAHCRHIVFQVFFSITSFFLQITVFFIIIINKYYYYFCLKPRDHWMLFHHYGNTVTSSWLGCLFSYNKTNSLHKLCTHLKMGIEFVILVGGSLFIVAMLCLVCRDDVRQCFGSWVRALKRVFKRK